MYFDFFFQLTNNILNIISNSTIFSLTYVDTTLFCRNHKNRKGIPKHKDICFKSIIQLQNNSKVWMNNFYSKKIYFI